MSIDTCFVARCTRIDIRIVGATKHSSNDGCFVDACTRMESSRKEPATRLADVDPPNATRASRPSFVTTA
ncbi:MULTISPECIES: hypothetical protein [Curtobacterium]|uniref:hypothetical protein n=1 Tax=Curtobacterium flaccumfaciens TaxID=2035 RepID=UPI003EE57AB0